MSEKVSLTPASSSKSKVHVICKFMRYSRKIYLLEYGRCLQGLVGSKGVEARPVQHRFLSPVLDFPCLKIKMVKFLLLVLSCNVEEAGSRRIWNAGKYGRSIHESRGHISEIGEFSEGLG